jgi:hypothetical protein
MLELCSENDTATPKSWPNSLQTPSSAIMRRNYLGMNSKVFKQAMLEPPSLEERQTCLAREATLLVTALGTHQDQVTIVGTINKASPLGIEVDAAIVAGFVVNSVVSQGPENIFEASVTARRTSVGRSVTAGTSGLDVAGGTWRS